MTSSAVAGGPRPELPPDALTVPLTMQATEYSCGAAALLSTLLYWHSWTVGHEKDLYAALETTEQNGTEPAKIAEVARTFGLDATLRTEMTVEDLRAGLKRGSTMILDIQAWSDKKKPKLPWKDTWDDGHYVVLVALDDAHAYFMDPSTQTSYAYIPLPELLERWHDYEDRHGTVERNLHLGIELHGRRAMRTFPARVSRLN